MAALVLTAALVTGPPIYISQCLEHPTCEVSVPSPPQREPLPATTTTESPPPSTSEAPTTVSAQGVERWRGLVAEFFPSSEVDTALRVMACESGGNPTALNPSGAAGLMQVHHPSWGDVYGVSIQDLFDPETNISIAADIWSKLGWAGQWSCY